MIEKISVANYRSIRDVPVSLTQLNVVTGPNGSGKSNLYKSLHLLAKVANGELINALAREGGISSAAWAGPEDFSRSMRAGEMPVQGGPRQSPVRLRFGFTSDEFSYAISLGLPQGDGTSYFQLDPEIKRECIWAGSVYRPASCLVDRNGPLVKVREGRGWNIHTQHMSVYESIISELADPQALPEVFAVRALIKSWRFYDHFRTDKDSMIRIPQIGTRTPVLDHNGHDLVAALRTIIEVGDRQALNESIEDAFPGAHIEIKVDQDNRFILSFVQEGLLRPLSQAELSDGTLRYLLLVAALLTPRPPSLLVLNEPETSLHPDLLPALARLIIKASEQTQVWVVSHANRLINALEESPECNSISLEKNLGETQIVGQGLLDKPSWKWPE